jgi:hypothetical protein
MPCLPHGLNDLTFDWFVTVSAIGQNSGLGMWFTIKNAIFVHKRLTEEGRLASHAREALRVEEDLSPWNL